MEYAVRQGDCENVADIVKGQKFDLVYLDPPYGTGRDFGAYDDYWADGRNGLMNYLARRIEKIRHVMAENSSILVHIDPKISHEIGRLLDELFGPGDRDGNADRPGYRNELIWVYGLGGSSRSRYPRKHDVIYWYTKGSEWTFTPPQVPATSTRMKGLKKKQPDVFATGGDIMDIPTINNMAKERSGYPTQKPLALLEQLVAAHSNPGDWVLDPFCGSGTTIVAARNLGRNAVGIDIGDQAVKTARERLGQP